MLAEPSQGQARLAFPQAILWHESEAEPVVTLFAAAPGDFPPAGSAASRRAGRSLCRGLGADAVTARQAFRDRARPIGG